MLTGFIQIEKVICKRLMKHSGDLDFLGFGSVGTKGVKHSFIAGLFRFFNCCVKFTFWNSCRFIGAPMG